MVVRQIGWMGRGGLRAGYFLLLTLCVCILGHAGTTVCTLSRANVRDKKKTSWGAQARGWAWALVAVANEGRGEGMADRNDHVGRWIYNALGLLTEGRQSHS